LYGGVFGIQSFKPMAMSDTEKRHTFQIAPNATATFNTDTPHPRTVEILQEVVKQAMKYEKPTALGGLVKPDQDGKI
jgi:hypothetical protein